MKLPPIDRRKAGKPLHHGLTPNQAQVLMLLCYGIKQSTIAMLRGTGLRCVQKQVEYLHKKTHCHCTAEMIRWALANRIIDPHEWIYNVWPTFEK